MTPRLKTVLTVPLVFLEYGMSNDSKFKWWKLAYLFLVPFNVVQDFANVRDHPRDVLQLRWLFDDTWACC